MSNAVTASFRALESATSETRKDEIVIAAISAFASRTRPTRLDANQLEDLALPTLPHTAPSTRRLAAATLSSLPFAPYKLVMRLCEEDQDICATLLLRSPVLQDGDLIKLIEKNGVPFARIIARRKVLTQNLRNLLLTLGDSHIAITLTSDHAASIHPAIKADPAEITGKLEAARNALRKMMSKQEPDVLEIELPKVALPEKIEHAIATIIRREPKQAAAKLRATALLADPTFFVTTLADMHGLSYDRAKRVLQRSAPSELMTALHAGGVATGDAFIIISAFYPAIALDKAEISLFLTRYDAMEHDQSLTNVRRWKAEEISLALRAKPANFERILDKQELKAG